MNEELLNDQFPETELSARQQRFCDEYLIDLNASAAARRAGYSERSAGTQGSRLLDNPAVRQYIDGKQHKIIEKLNRAIGIMAGELTNMALIKRGDFLDTEGDVKNVSDLPENLREAVQIQTKRIKCEGKVTTVTTYNLHNKMQMIERVTKRLLKGHDKVNEGTPEEINTAEVGNGHIEEI